MTTTPMDRPLASALALAAIALTVLGLASARADALGDLTCAGSQTNAFSPGMTNTPQSIAVTFTDTFGPCVSLTQPAIRSGFASSSVTVTRACTSLLGNGSATRTVTWNTGQTSTYTFNYTISYVGGQLVAVQQGAVTAGLFRGATQAATVTLIGDLTDCAAPGGLSGLFGPETFLLT